MPSRNLEVIPYLFFCMCNQSLGPVNSNKHLSSIFYPFHSTCHCSHSLHQLHPLYCPQNCLSKIQIWILANTCLKTFIAEKMKSKLLNRAIRSLSQENCLIYVTMHFVHTSIMALGKLYVIIMWTTYVIIKWMANYLTASVVSFSLLCFQC